MPTIFLLCTRVLNTHTYTHIHTHTHTHTYTHTYTHTHTHTYTHTHTHTLTHTHRDAHTLTITLSLRNRAQRVGGAGTAQTWFSWREDSSNGGEWSWCKADGIALRRDSGDEGV